MGDERWGRRIVVSGTDARKKERMEERNATSLGYRQARPAPARRLVATDRLANGGGAARLMGQSRACVQRLHRRHQVPRVSTPIFAYQAVIENLSDLNLRLSSAYSLDAIAVQTTLGNF